MEVTSQADTGPSISALSDADERRAALGLPIRDEPAVDLPGISGSPGSTTNSVPGTGPGAAGFSTPGQSVAGGVPGAQRKLEYKQPLPSPGSILGLSNADSAGTFNKQVGLRLPKQTWAPTAQQTYSPQVSTQAYSTAQAPMQAQPHKHKRQVSDAYLSQISDASLEVLEHFGAEAPVLLNQYACAVEDALIEQVSNCSVSVTDA